MSTARTNDTLGDRFLGIRRLPRPVATTWRSPTMAESQPGEGWKDTVDTLLHWLHRPSDIHDDDIGPPPSRMSLLAALTVATLLQRRGAAPPKRILPNSEGGVSFERWAGASHHLVETDDAGVIEIFHFEDERVVDRVKYILQEDRLAPVV